VIASAPAAAVEPDPPLARLLALTSNVGTRWLQMWPPASNAPASFGGDLEKMNSAISVLIGVLLTATLIAVPVLWMFGLL